jgi:hypothetical protein
MKDSVVTIQDIVMKDSVVTIQDIATQKAHGSILDFEEPDYVYVLKSRSLL